MTGGVSGTVTGGRSGTVTGGGPGTVTGGVSGTVKRGGLRSSPPHSPTILTEQEGPRTHQPRWAGEALARPHVHFTTSKQTRCSGRRRRRRRDRRRLKLFLPRNNTGNREPWLAHSRSTLWPNHCTETGATIGHSHCQTSPCAAGDTCTSQSCQHN